MNGADAAEPRRRAVRARPFDPAQAARWPAVIGCDEVGRGALCGPVVVAAAWFDPAAVSPALLGGLDDSKKVTPRARDRLCAMIRAEARVALAAAAAPAIDRDGIRAATLDAMTRAVRRLGVAAPVRVDGRETPPGLGPDAAALVRGETAVPQIAAASIVAKVARDRLMARLAARHPAYAWAANVGYGTAAHLAALDAHGATRHHRRSFAPVAAALNG